MEAFIDSLTVYDYVGITVVSVSLLLGISKGFIMIFGKVVSLILGFLGAKVLSTGVTSLVYNMLGGRATLYDKIFGVVESQADNGVLQFEQTITQAMDSLVVPLGGLKEKILTDTSFKLFINKESTDPLHDITMKILETVEPFLLYVLSIVLFIVLFIIIRIVLTQMTKFLNKLITGTHITGGLNTLLGGFLGLLRGLIFVAIGYYLLFMYITVVGEISFIDTDVLMGSRVFELIMGLKSYL